MRLNPDCIRDILLYVEENTDSERNCVEFSDICEALKFDMNTLDYHIRKLHSAELFDDVYYSDDTIDFVTSLSWEGHSYTDNIRDSKAWSMTKSATSKVSSVSVSILSEIAATMVKKLIFQN